MLEHLFGSKTRYRLLRVFFREPSSKFFVRELTRELDTQINAVRRELDLLCQSGVVEVVADKHLSNEETEDRRKYYRLNMGSIFFSDLQALLLKEHMLGEETFVEELTKKGGSIRVLLLTGIFSGDMRAPSDILFIGDVKERVINRLITEHEKEFGCSIRFTCMTEEEFFDRRHVMDRFLFALFEAKHKLVINELDI
ncbi:hypothetical protein KKG22_02210 [Patescibacteria group bacterium]|nr:hypothetical protein [Patescibacteria group bacterium]MBU1721834.1 hypothetical protein [Patescibacteria group bacterium]MBU1901671.1 hypothetical protein [Patescibacteria group bacterium]